MTFLDITSLSTTLISCLLHVGTYLSLHFTPGQNQGDDSDLR